MDGQFVSMDSLPSRGKVYPDDIEIYVKPLNIKEQMDMSRYGVTEAEYFRILLNGISIHGDFPKNELLFHDVQFLDLVRRLYTFDIEEEIKIDNIICEDCGEEFQGSFHFHELHFTDYADDAFQQEYTFSDGTTICVEPIRIKDFIDAGRKYFSSKKFSLTDIYLGYLVLCVTEVKDSTFKNKELMQDFLYNYFGNLYMAKDKKILKKIEEKSVSFVEPLKLTCPKCGEIVEVSVSPTTQFQQ